MKCSPAVSFDAWRLADELLEDVAHLQVRHRIGMQVDGAELAEHEIEQVGLVESLDLRVDLEPFEEDLADGLGEARDVVVQVNSRIAELTKRQPYANYTVFLNLYPTFTDTTGKQNVAFFVTDGVHPNQAGYQAWSEQLLPFLQQQRTH